MVKTSPANAASVAVEIYIFYNLAVHRLSVANVNVFNIQLFFQMLINPYNEEDYVFSIFQFCFLKTAHPNIYLLLQQQTPFQG